MVKKLSVCFVFPVLISLMACTVSQPFTSGSAHSLKRQWIKSGQGTNHHVGVTIYDPVARKTLFAYRDTHYFTPASNTKLLTLYVALQSLGDSLTSARYLNTNDTLYVWGGGDPGTWYPQPENNHPLISFLTGVEKPVVFSDAHFKAGRFGRGWAWDDFPYAFQCERTAFPIYGNRIRIERDQDSLTIKPHFFKSAFTISKDTVTRYGKTEWGDQYYYTYPSGNTRDDRSIPITFFENDTRYLWREVTGKNIFLSSIPIPDHTQVLHGSVTDTLLKIMMQESDNFIAEQILLNCSFDVLGYMSDKDFIEKSKSTILSNCANEPKWFDSSGLSRYNALTPATITDVLNRIYQLKGMEYIKAIFAAGGESGTLKNNFFIPGEKPYVYAKSGSLRDVYCLSGYLITKSGKVLLFSWMNNHIRQSKAALISEMENYLLFVYNHY